MVQETKWVSAATSSRQVGMPLSAEPVPPVRANRAGSAPAADVPQAFSRHRVAAYAQLQEAKDAQQNAAVADRQRLAEADAARQLAREMRANLVAIVKNYPPFPPESEERQRYLELAVGLRKQMEALMVPPPEKGGPPALTAEAQASLAKLSPQASDADVAVAAEALAQWEAGLTGYGEEIRVRWQSEPMSQESALQLSGVAAGQLSALSGALAAAARIPA